MEIKGWKRCFPAMDLQRKPKAVKMYQQLWMLKNAELNGTLLKSWLLKSSTPWATLVNYRKCSLPIIVIVQNLIKLCQVALVFPTNTAGCIRFYRTESN